MGRRASNKGSKGCKDREASFYHILTRAGIDPRDPELTVNYAVEMAEEQLEFERRQKFELACLMMKAVEAGNGDNKAAKFLLDGLQHPSTEKDSRAEAVKYSKMFGVSTEEVQKKLDAGWKPLVVVG